MAARDVAESVQNLDQRLARVLPTLATKEDLKPLATKEGLAEAVAKLATKEELRQLKDDFEVRIKDEGKASRRYMKILVEEIKGKIDFYAERVTAVDERDARKHAESVEADSALDRRVLALEAARSRRRRP